MIINHKYKFIFIHVPKCAGTAIKRALYPYCDKWDQFIGGHPDKPERIDYMHNYLDAAQWVVQWAAQWVAQLVDQKAVQSVVPWVARWVAASAAQMVVRSVARLDSEWATQSVVQSGTVDYWLTGRPVNR